MVVLETAAIGAAGYGIYKGGEVGIRKTKELQVEYQRESKRSIQRGELQVRTQTRQERIAKIMSMRRGGNGGIGTSHLISATTCTSTSTKEAVVTSTGISNEKNPSWLAATTSTTEQPSHRISTNTKNCSSVEDRHQAVMAKLHASRRDQAKKDQASSGSLWKMNPFAKRN
jgi:hypothetical protein